MNLSILQTYCKRRGYAQCSAKDGNEAFDAFVKAHQSGRTVTFSAVDLQMPNCNGIEATARIRQYEAEQGLPPSLIFMSTCSSNILISGFYFIDGCFSMYSVTGQSSDADEAQAMAAGCDGFYVKPMRIKMLDELIGSHFDIWPENCIASRSHDNI